VSVIPALLHTLPEPEIGAGNGWTVITAVTEHVPIAYVITDVPAETPVTTPVVDPVVATLALPLLHVPPATALSRVVDPPEHTFRIPEIADGTSVTVSTTALRQPLPEL